MLLQHLCINLALKLKFKTLKIQNEMETNLRKKSIAELTQLAGQNIYKSQPLHIQRDLLIKDIMRYKNSVDCPICKKHYKEIASGNMTPFNYRCGNGHTWGINENYEH